jgi:threonine dehydrogenase-like Zn-dependent dehydrogenase
MRKPGELVLEERKKPVPKDDEALFKVLQVGVCGTDLHAFEGNQPFFSYPRVLGHELALAAAEIPASARSGAKHFKEGDVVTVLPYLNCGTCAPCRAGKPNCCAGLRVLGVHIDGGMQEYLTLPVSYVVPAGKADPRDLPVVECFSIGFHGVRRGNPQPGGSALVVGAGPIGIGVIHGLRARGVRVIVMDVNEDRLAYARDIAQADYTVNSLRGDPEKALEHITGGDHPPFVFDATGNAGQMMRAFSRAGAGGTLVYVGLVQGDITFPDPLFHKKELSLLGSRNAAREDFAAVIAALESGRISTRGFVTHRASLEETPAQFASWARPETRCLKAVVTVGQEAP